MNVAVTVDQLPGPVPQPQYAGTGLVTDAGGNLTYVFRLDASVPNGASFQVRANASHPSGVWLASATDTFNVSSSAGFMLWFAFDQPAYRPASTVRVQFGLS